MQCVLPGLSIHYASTGEGRPFVLLHGSPGDGRRASGPFERALHGRKGWCRISPDLPGHGRTPGAARVRDIDDYLGVVHEFVDEILPHQRFSLGGISFGAYLALGFARRWGRRLDGLLLSVPEISFSPLEDRRDRAEGGSPDPTPEEAARIWKGYSEDTQWLQSLPWRDLSFDLYRKSRPFAAPALFLLGRQDASFRYRAYWKLVPDFPRGTFAVLDGAGHDLWGAQGRLAGALVHEWLDRVEAWAPPSRRHR